MAADRLVSTRKRRRRGARGELLTASALVSRERGQILPMVGLLAVVLIGMAGLALDVGRLMVARAQLRRAVDAATLAGSLELPDMADAETAVYTFEVPDAEDLPAVFDQIAREIAFRLIK